ncbi:hypothetical protein ACTODO_00869 [Schaalia dentiphila ATCC 17982]|uniref:Uncharacterized protein n=1 Tax=Schaalia dentiphila ATCC 17982 TaxID=411466 RepID=A7BB53_9ACTO|nr:hypothetical protein ACTODO_00869 [Schaalia odontolytica ATCC 17982]
MVAHPVPVPLGGDRGSRRRPCVTRGRVSHGHHLRGGANCWGSTKQRRGRATLGE